MVTQTIKVDLLNKIPSENIIFRQGEVGREIVFEVYNDGVAVDLDGYDVTFAIYKPDGNFVIVSGTVDNDTVTIEETEQMTAVCGRGCFDLKLSKTGEAIYTYNGFVEIDAPIEAMTTINSVSTVFGLVFPDDFQEKLTAGENITIVDNVISASGGGGGTYTAGDYISILNNVIDVKSSLISTINGKADASALNGKQDKLTAGTYIDIDASNNIDVKSSLISTINGKADASALNGKQDKLTAGTYIDIDASNNIDVKSSLISTINGKADTSALNGKQDKLTAGTNITIDANNVISASGGGGGGIDLTTPFYTFGYASTSFISSTWQLFNQISLNDLPAGDYLCYITVRSRESNIDKLRCLAIVNENADRDAPFNRAIVYNNEVAFSQFVAQCFIRRYANSTIGVYYSTTSAISQITTFDIYFYKIS